LRVHRERVDRLGLLVLRGRLVLWGLLVLLGLRGWCIGGLGVGVRAMR
jgi:hypothetical protein